MASRSAGSEFSAAFRALTEPRHPLARAIARIPDTPGLYAIYGDERTWQALHLGDPPDDRPLYVGKSESSLASRDIQTHFGNGRTGSSTVRRTFAALLRETLGLRARPRNPLKPERFANFGLSVPHDELLTAWMSEHLAIALWRSGPLANLRAIENAVLLHWLPPLNLQGMKTEWRESVMAARAVMASEARRSAGRQR